MNSIIRIRLACSSEQHTRLKALQQEFAQACNRVSEIARVNRCWNRVALHHLAYRVLRERFPQLGSQMACNAIYSVCRACRWAYQHPQSPLKAAVDGGQPLAPILFLNSAPVYFDRHTLSLSEGQLSMYTLDGRMHFQLGISQADQDKFMKEKLKEVALTQAQTHSVSIQHIPLVPGATIQLKSNSSLAFELVFWFEGPEALPSSKKPSALDLEPESQAVGPLTMQPPYLIANPSMTAKVATLPNS